MIMIECRGLSENYTSGKSQTGTEGSGMGRSGYGPARLDRGSGGSRPTPQIGSGRSSGELSGEEDAEEIGEGRRRRRGAGAASRWGGAGEEAAAGGARRRGRRWRR